MNVEIKAFNFSYWPQFVDLINKYWKVNHPIINKELFEWQYTGFGPQKGIQNSKLLFVNGKIEGFRGAIPGIYQINGKHLAGYSGSVWIINQEFRGLGLGSLMVNEINSKFDVHCSLGVNVKTAGAIYKKKGYAGFDALNRYVIPLIPDEYLTLLSAQVSFSKINSWFQSVPLKNQEKQIKIDGNSLQRLWEKTLGEKKFFGLYRNNSFWNWRYLNNIGFKYLFFGNPETVGIVIVRVEKVLNERSQKVLRIIEILPANIDTWNKQKDPRMKNLLLGVLSWAKENGCVAADFQISNTRLSALLEDVGFLKQNENYLPPEVSLAGLFQPFVLKPAPINGTYFIKDKSGNQVIPELENTYFVKSDNDMDRTNYWPVID